MNLALRRPPDRRAHERAPEVLLPAALRQRLVRAVALLPLLAFFTGTRWQDWAVCVALYWVRMFWVTGAYHRYFSHRTYKTSRVFQFLLAFLAQSSAQKGALWWAAHHRNHHKLSDQDVRPPLAVASTASGTRTWTWLFAGTEETDYSQVKDPRGIPSSSG